MWNVKNNMAVERLGYLPQIIRTDDERPVSEQITDRYAHGGGWMPFDGFEILTGGYSDPQNLVIQYPDDPPYEALAWVQVGKELVVVFPHAWVMVMQPDETFKISRMD